MSFQIECTIFEYSYPVMRVSLLLFDHHHDAQIMALSSHWWMWVWLYSLHRCFPLPWLTCPFQIRPPNGWGFLHGASPLILITFRSAASFFSLLINTTISNSLKLLWTYFATSFSYFSSKQFSQKIVINALHSVFLYLHSVQSIPYR